MISGVAALDAEWAEAQRILLDRCERLLAGLGMSDAGLAYVRQMKGYPRVPYFAAIWVPEARQRRELGMAICMHAMGIKLVDDLMDADQPIRPWDQILGVHLMQAATTVFGRYAAPDRVLAAFDDDYRVIWRKQVEEASRPADSLETWIGYARVKSGRMMMCYATAACLAADVADRVPAARDFTEAFGVLFMIGDDLRDFRDLDEKGGNLVHLIRTGRVDADRTVEAIRHWRDEALRALDRCPPVFPVRNFMADFADRLVTTIWELTDVDF
jgi:hypothetical protein